MSGAPTAPVERDDQPSLFDDAPPWARQSVIDRAFWRFHSEHPEVYRQLVALVRSAKAVGRTKVGIGMLFEVLRWNAVVGGDVHEDFKLNNNYRSRYSRLIEDREPDLVGMFEKRRLTA